MCASDSSSMHCLKSLFENAITTCEIEWHINSVKWNQHTWKVRPINRQTRSQSHKQNASRKNRRLQINLLNALQHRWLRIQIWFDFSMAFDTHVYFSKSMIVSSERCAWKYNADMQIAKILLSMEVKIKTNSSHFTLTHSICSNWVNYFPQFARFFCFFFVYVFIYIILQPLLLSLKMKNYTWVIWHPAKVNDFTPMWDLWKRFTSHSIMSFCHTNTTNQQSYSMQKRSNAISSASNIDHWEWTWTITCNFTYT